MNKRHNGYLKIIVLGQGNHGSFNHIRSITLALRLYFILTSTQNFSSPYLRKLEYVPFV